MAMTESATPTNERQLQDTWDAFTDRLKTMGRDALASAPTDIERSDGLRLEFPREIGRGIPLFFLRHLV